MRSETVRPRKTLRNKIILLFISMIVIMIIGTVVTLTTFFHINQISNKVNEEHQPAAYYSLELINRINKTSSLVNDYLLTKDEKFKSEVYLLKRHILKKLSENKHESLHQAKKKNINKLMSEYFNYIDTLFTLRDSQIDNYPGLALTIRLTDPHTLAYLGILNEAINSEPEDLSESAKHNVMMLLNDLRYSWIQMNNAYRIFISTRADNDMINFYSYSDVNGATHKKLRAMNVDIGFGVLDELESHRRIRLKNVPKVVKVFQSEGWRRDIYILKTKVYPLLNQINSILETYSNNQVSAASNESRQLNLLINNTTLIVSLILFIGLIITFAMAIIIQRSVKPLFELERQIHNRTIKTPMQLNEELLSLDNEIGSLARVFDKMNSNIIQENKSLIKAENKFEVLLYSLPTATIIIDKLGRIRLFNNEAELLFGYAELEILGKSVERLMPERFSTGPDTLLEKFTKSPELLQLSNHKELYGIHKDGHEFQVEISLSRIDMKNDLMVSASIRDITEHVETEKRLTHQANYDILTDLPNRILVMTRLEQAIVAAKRDNNNVAVMFIDLDQFKNVNDTLGHSVGDKLLCRVAERLKNCVRTFDTVSRLGGDEFLVILPDVSSLRSTETIADKIITVLSKPYCIDNRDLYISASIGITGYPNDAKLPEVLFRNADAAMYQAKNAGRNTYRFFTDEMNNQLVKRLNVESELRKAIQNNELFIHYQPQFDLKTNTLVGVEALLRWTNPVLGSVDTEEFIAIAEETGMIDSIGDWVLQEACQAVSRWQHKYPNEIRLSVNISAVQFRVGDLVQKIKNTLEQTHFPPHLLELEITERILVEDNPSTSRILNDIKKLGIRLSLDDFGKGYSSLSYLKRFPFDVLKIDRSFIADLNVDKESTLLCKAISAMANSLQLDIIAEGVETSEQYLTVREMGVNIAQGHYFGKPMRLDEFNTQLSHSSFAEIY